MLVTLDLITSNIYSSVNAPANRSFSYIEAWMMIVYTPIFVALLEYGILLAIKKYKIENSISDYSIHVKPCAQDSGTASNLHFHKMSKKTDLITFTSTLIFILISNLLYWGLILK